MAYCNLDDMRRLLPPNVTIGNRNIGTPSPGATNRDNITENDAYKYILYAQEYIEARLRPFYVCPLRKIKSCETDILSNITKGANVSVAVYDNGAFLYGDNVRIQNRFTSEMCVVKEIKNTDTIILVSVANDYTYDESLEIAVIKYPEQIVTMTARLAVSFAFDRLFVETNSPDISNYGKTQRNLSRDAMENLLTGEAQLDGQDYTGRRFVRGTVMDAYSSPAEVTKGQEGKEG